MIKSKPATRVPGDTMRELTAPATDTQGRHWGRGTRFQPQSSGMDHRLGRIVARVVILDRGERVDSVFA